MENTSKTINVLVGDDEIGVEGSLQRRSFVRNYEGLANFEYATTPKEFIRQASTKKYDCIITDLNYTHNNQEGFEVLRQVKGMAPIIILHTSDETAMENELDAGATHFMQKGRRAEILENILKGVK